MRMVVTTILVAGGIVLSGIHGPAGAATLRKGHARSHSLELPAYPYGWPLRPFDEPHPIRGGFDDPRIGRRGHDFHFGIDISAVDGTPVYAVAAGVVYYERWQAVGIRVAPGRAFDYWHISPVVGNGAAVAEHQLIGFVAPGWGHVHFTEIERGYVVNPTRPGALEPLRDHVAPTIGAVTASSGEQPLDLQRLQGRIDLVAEVADTADLRPPAPWSDAVLMPALVRWRLVGADPPTSTWVTAVDFRTVRLTASTFDDIYAPGTRQNVPGRRGRYRVFLAHGLDTTHLSGPYELQVEAEDTSGNTTVKRIPVAFVAARRR